MDFLCHRHTGVLALTGSLYGNRCNLSRVQWETWATLMTEAQLTPKKEQKNAIKAPTHPVNCSTSTELT